MTGKDERCTDFIIIDGNENDLMICSHEDKLMNRRDFFVERGKSYKKGRLTNLNISVWRLSKPPSEMKLNQPTITARRIYRQNRLIKSNDASIRRSAGDNAREKCDKGREVKDPCGCCDACPSSQNYQRKSMTNEEFFHDLPNDSKSNF